MEGQETITKEEAIHVHEDILKRLPEFLKTYELIAKISCLEAISLLRRPIGLVEGHDINSALLNSISESDDVDLTLLNRTIRQAVKEVDSAHQRMTKQQEEIDRLGEDTRKILDRLLAA